VLLLLLLISLRVLVVITILEIILILLLLLSLAIWVELKLIGRLRLIRLELILLIPPVLLLLKLIVLLLELLVLLLRLRVIVQSLRAVPRLDLVVSASHAIHFIFWLPILVVLAVRVVWVNLRFLTLPLRLQSRHWVSAHPSSWLEFVLDAWIGWNV